MSEVIEFCRELHALAADMVDDKGETMKRWDEIRSQVTRLPGSDLPRLNFESLMEGIAEKITKAAELIDITETGNAAICAKNDELQAVFEAMRFDLVESLKAVLHFYGPEGADQVTRHVLMAREAKDRNDEIDALEKVLTGPNGEPDVAA